MTETPGNYNTEELDNMVRIQFSIPRKLHDEAIALGEAEGWKPSEIHRLFWVLGFGVHAEASNKRLVNRNLRNKN